MLTKTTHVGCRRTLPNQTLFPLRCSCTRLALLFSTSLRRATEPDFEAARKWYNKLGGSPVPKEIGEVSYSRSSGPGGQNVNKVNSKAQLRVLLSDLLPLLPSAIHESIKSSRYYSEKTTSILIQSDESRKQAANKDECYRRLDQLILDAYKSSVPGETSEEQKDKVKELKKSENEARIRLKKYTSNKKQARKGRED